MESFAARLLDAPVGVALLAKLEGLYRRDAPWFGGPGDSQPEAVGRAVDAVAEMEIGSLVALALEGAHDIAGPWNPQAATELPEAYRCAIRRAPIAEAVATTFGPALHLSHDRSAQQWWNGTGPVGWKAQEHVCFRDFAAVYGAGEFPWDGLWTVTDPPSEAHDPLISAWEMDHGPVSRWLLPVRPDARVFEIHDPGDWVRLVATYPHLADRPHEGWELPGPNQPRRHVEPLVAGGHRQAARDTVAAHLVPDWSAVANDFDGVHLSWAGFITSEGYISDLPDGAVTMLRYWSSERTLWLADVFQEPLPLPAPTLTGCINGALGTDARTDPALHQAHHNELTVLLGRRR
jgi:hypothetical protein